MQITNSTLFRYTRIRDVKAPHRGTPLSAGIDFFIPKFNQKFIEDLILSNKSKAYRYEHYLSDNSACDTTGFKLNEIRLKPGERILVPLGVHVQLPKGWHMIFFNKGSISSKKGLDVLACVVDEDYQGEVFLSLVNTGDEEILIEEDDKIIQGVLLQTEYFPLTEINTLEELYPEKTERGAGAFGSTDEKTK